MAASVAPPPGAAQEDFFICLRLCYISTSLSSNASCPGKGLFSAACHREAEEGTPPLQRAEVNPNCPPRTLQLGGPGGPRTGDLLLAEPRPWLQRHGGNLAPPRCSEGAGPPEGAVAAGAAP